MLNSAKSEIRSSNNHPTLERVILSCGRLIKRKGFDLLIEAAVLLSSKMPGFKLYIVGNGPERENLQSQIGKSNLTNKAFLLGAVDDVRLNSLLHECDLFVLANIELPNGDAEGSSTVAIEASACGKPIVVGAAGGTSSAVTDGVTGYLVDPKDTKTLADLMFKILTNRTLALSLGEAGQKKVLRDHDPAKNSRTFHNFLYSIESESI